MEPVERNSKREVRDYVVVEVCGVEPKGSQYRVKWENYDNKKRGEVMKLESVLNSSQLITEYLLSASGITRMNTIKKMFNAAASVKTQKSQLISSFSYKSWAEQVKNHTLPHKYIHRVVLLQLQQSGCRSQDHLRTHLKNKSKFPDKARFTAWVVPCGFHNKRVGDVVIPVMSLATEQVSSFFKTRNHDAMTAYAEKIRTSLDRYRCVFHWISSTESDARDDIIRSPYNDQYEVCDNFYSN